MIKTVCSVLVFFLMIYVGSAGSDSTKTEHRGPSGKLLYTTKTKGNTTEARRPSGKLLWKAKTRGSRTEVRSPSGKLLEWFERK